MKLNEKKKLRTAMKGKLEELNLPLYEDLSCQIARNLYSDVSWVEARTIGITLSRAPEVDTFQLIRKAWEQGKRVAVPKCQPKNREMIFRQLTRFAQLETVYSNLYEPVEAETEMVEPDKIDLLIVPGLAFTKTGYRLGFGGGYYDRFLKCYSGRTLALAFEQQLVPDLPIETHDLPVSKIVTENGVFHCVDQ
ncbi:5-formyltetrahydrofolate cyclo-ligase [Mesobacillus foraminis]|uniref:5-formyltetrahydrofolate cyclo-ligase n=1 Tax=Mesobacillus foraminis TaxID=279826 RepID=UPI001BEA16B2|nr:5-formyltetrahydrofolate cyclo-ligase [Mesobacillus foraminis]MBT2754731.1 5-formyltetrahydrofolate cyclo-ligase [Mesobacillus foraminis]